jgi:hypothetical protein
MALAGTLSRTVSPIRGMVVIRMELSLNVESNSGGTASMPHWRTNALALMVVSFLSGCGLFDSGVEWRDGPYELLWLDFSEQTSLNYDLGKHGSSIGVVDSTVFAVGSNDRYIIVKQHLQGNKAVTNYFIVDKREVVPTDPIRAVLGPLTQAEFTVQARSLHLPQFTTVLNSLE